MLNLTAVYSMRDIALCPEIGLNVSPIDLAKEFFDAEMDPYFRSTITEARLYFTLYKSFEQEVDDVYLKQSILVDFDVNDVPLNHDMDNDAERVS